MKKNYPCRTIVVVVVATCGRLPFRDTRFIKFLMISRIEEGGAGGEGGGPSSQNEKKGRMLQTQRFKKVN